MNPQKHQSLTYQSNENTLKFADWLESIGKPVWLRYVLVPGYTDNAQDLELFGKKFESDKNIESVDILPYHKLGVYKYNELGIPYHLDGISSPTSDEILKAKHILEQYFKRVIVR